MSSRPRLLIVDDDTAMREMLASLFSGRGYAIEEAASAAEALDRAGEQCFDVVLSDIRMPGKPVSRWLASCAVDSPKHRSS